MDHPWPTVVVRWDAFSPGHGQARNPHAQRPSWSKSSFCVPLGLGLGSGEESGAPPGTSSLPWNADFTLPRSGRNGDSEGREEDSGDLLASPWRAGVLAPALPSRLCCKTQRGGTCEGPGESMLAAVQGQRESGDRVAGERVEKGAPRPRGAIWVPFFLVWKLPGVSLGLV